MHSDSVQLSALRKEESGASNPDLIEKEAYHSELCKV
jgi:hypothetical protein